jgi:uncharacterized membrane protein
MTTTDWILDLGFIGIVFLQVRGRRLNLRLLVLPVALSAWAAANYLKGIPTAGNDLVLVAFGLGLGVTLGALAGMFTKVTKGPDGYAYAKAGVLAAIFWVAGVGTRLVFQLYVTHGGAGALARFSASHSITSAEAWVAALILMAIGEALVRTAVVAFRGYRAGPEHFAGRTTMMGAGDRAY